MLRPKSEGPHACSFIKVVNSMIFSGTILIFGHGKPESEGAENGNVIS